MTRILYKGESCLFLFPLTVKNDVYIGSTGYHFGSMAMTAWEYINKRIPPQCGTLSRKEDEYPALTSLLTAESKLKFLNQLYLSAPFLEVAENL